MLQNRVGTPVLALAVGLLLAVSFIAGFLLLARPARPGDKDELAAAGKAPTDAGAVMAVVAEAVPAVATAPPAPPASPASPPPSGGPVVRSGRARAGTGTADPLPPPRDGSCDFDATIYDVRVKPEQISRMDIDALAQSAGTSEPFEKGLSALGVMRPLYRAHKAITYNLEDYFKITNETPFITTAPATLRGAPFSNNNGAFKTTGATFDLIAKDEGGGAVGLDMSIQATILVDENASLTNTLKVPVFRTAAMQEHRNVTLNKPFIFVSADASILDGDGKAICFVARVVLASQQSAPVGK